MNAPSQLCDWTRGVRGYVAYTWQACDGSKDDVLLALVEPVPKAPDGPNLLARWTELLPQAA